jgi:hypothetical protein
MDGAQWEMLASAAQVRVPSDDTRVLALSMLRAREDARRRLASLRRRKAASTLQAHEHAPNVLSAIQP